MDCIFCRIIAGEIPSEKVYEDQQTLAFLDINPINPGHTLVVPKEHFEDLLSTPDEVLAGLMVVVKKIGQAICSGVQAQGFNVGLNNGQAAGQVVFHAHFHVMPRFGADSHRLWQGKKYQAGEAAAVGNKLRKAIQV